MTLLVLEEARRVKIIFCFLSFQVMLFASYWWQDVGVTAAGFGIIQALVCGP